MANQSPSPLLSPSDVKNRTTRKATCLKDLTMRYANGHKTLVDIYVLTGAASSRNTKTLQSYFEFLIHEHISILIMVIEIGLYRSIQPVTPEIGLAFNPI